MKSPSPIVYCVIPNLNGAADLAASIDSVLSQSHACKLVVVDNGSTDNSRKIIQSYGEAIDAIYHKSNLGFAGGVNSGIRFCIENGATHVALFNNDAVADKGWLKHLVAGFRHNSKIGIVTGRLLKQSRDAVKEFDSTGDFYSTWCVAFPRGRGQKDTGQYNTSEYVFGASGGASLYDVRVFNEIGMFDEDFFAYYEDVDLSFRAQLAGWKIFYESKAVAWHKIGATSSKIPGFTTYHTIKNVLWLPIKNLPMGLLLRSFPKFLITYGLLIISQLSKGNIIPVIKGVVVGVGYIPKKIIQRQKIQMHRAVTNQYIESILYRDLPPDRYKLRKLRSKIVFWKSYENSH